MRKGEAKLSARSIRLEDERWRWCASANGGSTVAEWNKEDPVATSTGSGVLRRGEEHSNLARGGSGKPIGCLHGMAREGAEQGRWRRYGQRGKKRRSSRLVTVAKGQILFFSQITPKLFSISFCSLKQTCLL